VIVREPWWVFPGLLEPALCDRIIAHGLSLERYRAEVRTGDDGSQRKTSVSWIEELWLYEAVVPWVFKANAAAGWNFQIECTQPLQFGVYEVGGHYTWHRDDRSGRVYGASDNVSPEFHGLIRKVSFTILLNGDGAYDGGDLQFSIGLPDKARAIENATPERARGTMIVFPSFLAHRVTPVRRGVRYSLVGWTCGRPWR
jgi:PKHD-type hydroxylase